MAKCSEDVPDIPSFVNMTILRRLMQEGKVKEALSLLAPNTTVENYTSSTCTFLTTTTARFATDNILISVYGWILILTSIFGILGNSLVGVVYLRKSRKLTTYKWLLVHLAMCDFIFSIFQIITALPTVANVRWLLHGDGCKFFKSFTLLGSLVAIGTMLVIAIERYVAVLKPLKREGRERRVALALMFVWLASVVSIIPSGLALTYSEETDDCDERWDHSGLTRTGNTIYSYYMLIAFFVLPLLAIIMCYSKVMKHLWMSRETYGFLYQNASAEVLERKHKSQRRTMKVLGACVIVFSICVLPGKICFIIIQHIDVKSLPIQSYYTLMYAGMLPYPFHVAVNPFIYSFVDSTFRQSVSKLFNYLYCRILKDRKKENALVLKSPEELNVQNTVQFQYVKWQPLPQEVDVLS